MSDNSLANSEHTTKKPGVPQSLYDKFDNDKDRAREKYNSELEKLASTHTTVIYNYDQLNKQRETLGEKLNKKGEVLDKELKIARANLNRTNRVILDDYNLYENAKSSVQTDHLSKIDEIDEIHATAIKNLEELNERNKSSERTNYNTEIRKIDKTHTTVIRNYEGLDEKRKVLDKELYEKRKVLNEELNRELVTLNITNMNVILDKQQYEQLCTNARTAMIKQLETIDDEYKHEFMTAITSSQDATSRDATSRDATAKYKYKKYKNKYLELM